MTAAKGNRYGLRPGQSEPSTKRHLISVTETEHAEHRALAEYLGTTVADLFRQLMREKRESVTAEGKRVPKKPRDA